MGFKDFKISLPIEDVAPMLLELLNLLRKPCPQNPIFKPEENEAIKKARTFILNGVKRAQSGSRKEVDSLMKKSEKIKEYERHAKENRNVVGLLRTFRIDPPNHLLPPFQRDDLLQFLNPETPSGVYAWDFIQAIKQTSDRIEGGIPWERIKNCPVCGAFFLRKKQKGRPQDFCSAKCRGKLRSTPYAKREGYFKVRRKFESLLGNRKRGMTIEEALAWLNKTSPYKEIIKRKNLHPEEWLKKGGD